jgi:hypothetical protein
MQAITKKKKTVTMAIQLNTPFFRFPGSCLHTGELRFFAFYLRVREIIGMGMKLERT